MLAQRTTRWSDTTISKLTRLQIAAGAPAGRLTVVFPRALAAPFAVAGQPFVLGRHGDGAIRHPTVSRAHAVIEWSAEASAHVVRDLGSHNGSALDGTPLVAQPRTLGEGSVLRLGDVLAVWEAGVAPVTGEPEDPSDEIPGRAASVQALRAAIGRAARDHAPVLILGETGSGKERVARELHRQSGRAGPLVAINCAALQPSLVESELFGHSRGAFTGAHEAQRGFFRDAHGGTLFLDEIGELPVALQAKLLRVIQEQQVQPVGSADPVVVDVRVLAATHRQPAEAIAAGVLREDLYARLSLWELHVPPLRARRVDLPDWLVRMHDAWAGARRALPPLSTDAMEALLLQPWPLNLRSIERLVREIATRGRPGADRVALIEPADLPAWLAQPAEEPPPSAPRPPLPSRDEFIAAFEQLGGSVRALARHFGRERRQIYRWIDAHGVRRQP